MATTAAGCHYFQAALILRLQTSIYQPQVTVFHPREETKSKNFHSNSKAIDSHAKIILNLAVNKQKEQNLNKTTPAS